MQKINGIVRKDVLLPQSLGDHVKWYGYHIYYIDMDALGADMSHGLRRDDTSTYKHTLAVGQVGYDVLPSLGVCRPQYVSGKCATDEATTYLLRVLGLTDHALFTFEERNQGWGVYCDIAPRATRLENIPV